MITDDEKTQLFKVHCLRQQAHWGKNADVNKNWPQTRAEWTEAEHGSPCDTNIHMAKFHLKLAQSIKDGNLLT